MNPEKLFADMARIYVDKEGERLRSEGASLMDGAPFPPSKDFERKIAARIRVERFRRPAYIMGSIAACIIVALIGINILRSFNGDLGGFGGFGNVDVGGGGARLAPDSQVAMGGANSDMIALAFNLPPNCSVAGVEQDVGKTIFHINDIKNDNIVLVAEKSDDIGGTGKYDENKLKGSGLKKIEINGTTLYAVAKADFSRFTFKKEGVIYDMTCKYDYNTLIAFCEYIL